MEILLHFCWKHKLFPLGQLHTADGQELEIIDVGLHNRNAGPDFFNAKMKIGGTLWVGNVEIHQRSSDWYLHGHQNDSSYNNVVLHVCSKVNREVRTADGRLIPQFQLEVPSRVEEHYRELLSTDNYPPCYKIVPELSRLTVCSWMSALQTERLEQKTSAIAKRAETCNGSWETAYFVTLARNYGFGINSDAFETWAKTVPLHQVAHHRDNLFQVEAIFMGQTGLLDTRAIPERHRENAAAEGYFDKLRNEYLYLAHKFSMEPMDYRLWRFLRLRPQNFPHIRISQLAHLYYQHRTSLSQLVECTNVQQLETLFRSSVTPYWETHYAFGVVSNRNSKHLSASSVQLLLINTAIPMLFAWGQHRMNNLLCDRAFDFLEQLKAEDNHIIRMWQQCGLEVNCAGDSQALIQLKNKYCDNRDCLRCRIGFEWMKRGTEWAKNRNI